MSRSSLSSLDTINMIGNTMASLDQLIEDSWTDSIALDMLFDEDSTNIIVTNAPPRRRTLSRLDSCSAPSRRRSSTRRSSSNRTSACSKRRSSLRRSETKCAYEQMLEASLKRKAARKKPPPASCLVDEDEPKAEDSLIEGAEAEGAALVEVALEMSHGIRVPLPELYAHEIFLQQAAATPDAIALRLEGKTMTYAELAMRSKQVASKLIDSNVPKGSLIAVFAERSFELLAGMLGTMLAGCAYAPVDVTYPRQRIEWMLEDLEPPVVLTTAEMSANLPPCAAGSLLFLDQLEDCTPASALELEARRPLLDDVAFVIFSSGSTGRPKGSLNTHSGLVNQVVAFHDQFTHVGPQDIVFQFASTAFDMSVIDMFLALDYGACLHLWRNQVWYDALMEAKDVTYFEMTPSAAALIDPADLPCMRCVALGGEPVPMRVAQRWIAAGVQIFNVYGPSECSIHSTTIQIRADDTEMTIGKPMANTDTYILDEYLHPVPVGVPGELHIGGVAVSRGYLKRPELTASKFIDNPFGAGMLYKSGDLVKWTADGSIVHMGRLDAQVKLRGQRVELGEIEDAALAEVREAVAHVVEPMEGEQWLVLYVVTDSFDEGALRSYLSSRLPRFMVPDTIVLLEHLPLSPNGKVDRKQLPMPDRVRTPSAAVDEHLIIAPRSTSEAAARDVFASVLGRDALSISVDASFFSLGGSSLQAIRLARELTAALEREVAIMQVMQLETIAALAAASVSPTVLPPLNRTITPEDLLSSHHPISPSQAQMLLQIEMGGEQAAAIDLMYHIPIAKWLVGPLNVKALRAALTEVMERHAVLRTSYETETTSGAFVQHVHLSSTADEVLCEQTAVSDEAAVALAKAAVRTPLQLTGSNARTMHCTLVRVAPERHLFLITVHHVAFDGASILVLLSELSALYTSFTTGATVADAKVAHLPFQYADYAVWQQQSLPFLQSALDYWRDELRQGDLPTLELPFRKPRPAVQTYTGDAVTMSLGSELTAQLEALAATHGCSLYPLMLSLWGLLLCRHSGQSEVVIGSPYHGRDAPGTEHLLGYFVNMIAMRLEAPRNGTLADLLEGAKRTASGAFRHAAVPFTQVVGECVPKLARDPATPLMYQAALAWQDGLGLDSEWGLGSAVTSELVGAFQWGRAGGTAIVDLVLNAARSTEGSIDCSLEFNTDLFDRARIEELASHLVSLAELMVSTPEGTDVWAMPLPLNGKVDRKQLSMPALVRADAVAVDGDATELVQPRNVIEEKVRGAFAEMLQLDASSISVHENFYALGGNSLKAVMLSRMLAKLLGTAVSASDVVQGPTVALIAAAIEKQMARRRRRSSILGSLMNLDARSLPEQVHPIAPAAANHKWVHGEVVLLTGATGLLGSFLLRDLLRDSGATVVCLVRTAASAPADEPMRRVLATAQQYGAFDCQLHLGQSKRVVAISGDLGLPQLGLHDAQWAKLADEVVAIYHCGALLNFQMGYEGLRAANVQSTAEVLKLATLGSHTKPVHFVSTLGIFNDRVAEDAEDVGEDAPRPTLYTATQGMGYTETKWVSEALCEEARARGVPVTIYRPGRILGASKAAEEGASHRLNPDDFLVRMMRGCVQLGCYPQARRAEQGAPVDFVSASLVAISMSADSTASHNAFALIDDCATCHWSGLLRWASEMGYAMEAVSWDAFLAKLEQVVVCSAQSDDNVLGPLLPVLAGIAHADDQPQPHFLAEHTHAAIAAVGGISCAPLDEAEWSKYVRAMVAGGLLPAVA